MNSIPVMKMQDFKILSVFRFKADMKEPGSVAQIVLPAGWTGAKPLNRQHVRF